MSILNDPNQVLALSTGHHKNRISINHKDVNDQILFLFEEVTKNLELIFDLTLLDGALTCDEFHQRKRDFINNDYPYGRIHSYVSRIGKTNAFRFEYRPLMEFGDEYKKTIKVRRSTGGYSDASFNKSDHVLEKDLCISTEKQYLFLRARSKAIRNFLRLIAKIKPQKTTRITTEDISI